MTEFASVLSSWGSFYVIVGSSGGALIGLQFVVITLIAGSRLRTNVGALSAFGTPTVVHLTSALVLSAIMSAPWATLARLSVALAIWGVGGLTYGAIVLRRARRQKEYEPVWEDWLWHTILPFASYAALTVSAVMLHAGPQPALSMVGIAALTLLLIGIHNAWDTVVHIVLSSGENGANEAG
jgi:hypothetical protein